MGLDCQDRGDSDEFRDQWYGATHHDDIRDCFRHLLLVLAGAILRAKTS